MFVRLNRQPVVHSINIINSDGEIYLSKGTSLGCEAWHESIISFVKLHEGSAVSGYDWRKNERWDRSGPVQRGRERSRQQAVLAHIWPTWISHGPDLGQHYCCLGSDNPVSKHSRENDRPFTIIWSGFSRRLAIWSYTCHVNNVSSVLICSICPVQCISLQIIFKARRYLKSRSWEGCDQVLSEWVDVYVVCKWQLY